MTAVANLAAITVERMPLTVQTSSDGRALIDAAHVVGQLRDGRDVMATSVPKGEALDAWLALKQLHGETGLWPFLTDPKRESRWKVPVVWDFLGSHRATDSDEPYVGDVHRLLAQWREDHLAEDEDDPFDDDDEEDDAEDCAAAYRCEPLNLPATPRPGGSWAAETVEIGLCPAQAGGIEIVRLIGWNGACNYGITGAEHEAVLEYWRKDFGAELLTLAFDVIELAVPNPPTDPAVVARVAEEQTSYCPGVVDQGVGTATALALEQVYGHTWFFWWD